MKSTTWWIMASICFLVGIIMGLFSSIFAGAAMGAYLAWLDVALVVAGWVLWAIGLVNWFRER